jgi:hypothetical protein
MAPSKNIKHLHLLRIPKQVYFAGYERMRMLRVKLKKPIYDSTLALEN